MAAAEDQPAAQTGSPVTAKLWVAVRLKALVTVAVKLGGELAVTQAGAVQETRLEAAVLVGELSKPVLADQEKVSAEPSGSRASTSKVSTWPGEAVPEEPEKEVMTGLRWLVVEVLLTHRLTVPVACPPRSSETATVRSQLLQAPAGSMEGVNRAELEEVMLQEPGHEALQE
jgi:hypothetical protein